MSDLDSDRLRDDVEARDEVHSLTRDNGSYWCRRCDGGPWTSTMEASRTPCPGTPKET